MQKVQFKNTRKSECRLASKSTFKTVRLTFSMANIDENCSANTMEVEQTDNDIVLQDIPSDKAVGDFIRMLDIVLDEPKQVKKEEIGLCEEPNMRKFMNINDNFVRRTNHFSQQSFDDVQAPAAIRLRSLKFRAQSILGIRMLRETIQQIALAPRQPQELHISRLRQATQVRPINIYEKRKEHVQKMRLENHRRRISLRDQFTFGYKSEKIPLKLHRIRPQHSSITQCSMSVKQSKSYTLNNNQYTVTEIPKKTQYQQHFLDGGLVPSMKLMNKHTFEDKLANSLCSASRFFARKNVLTRKKTFFTFQA